ncbi:hypothetical protein TURU_076827 [Turdus rufiventris]|nr:hypothetical protein TURU_076827 [Turdus rufiventris]
MNRWEREKRRLKKRLIRQRILSKNVYYYRCPDHRKNYVMSFAFCFDREDDTYQFAYCYPYTYTRLQHYLDNLQRRNMDYFCRELLGLSVNQKAVKAADPSFEKKPSIYCEHQNEIICIPCTETNKRLPSLKQAIEIPMVA